MTRRSERMLMAVAALLAIAGLAAATAPEPVAVLAQRDAYWNQLAATEQTELAARVQAWDALPVQERHERRARYQAWRELGETDRARLRIAARAFAALPAEEQARLHTLFAAQNRMQQEGWRLGPELGADWPRLQPLFAYVPAGERGALLSLLRQLDASQREDLAALAQRIPPQEREGFRHQLLRVPAAQRADWLARRRSQ